VHWLPWLALPVALSLGCKGRGPESTTLTFDAAVVALPGTPCGPLSCRAYDSPEEAFESALASHPLVVGVGEAHAQKGAAAPSAASRFTEAILPTLRGRASDLLIELMKPPEGCDKATAKVRQEQKAVTDKQAAPDQNEYVTMGNRARELGIVPDLLRPTCHDLDVVKAAADDAVEASLRLIKTLMVAQAGKLVARNASDPAADGKIVVTYGGALHVQPEPTGELASYAFGPDFQRLTNGRYVAIDLYVPEYVEASDTLKAEPFYAHYDRVKMAAKTVVFRQGGVFVIVLPRSAE
jgi:hypothetical protein